MRHTISNTDDRIDGRDVEHTSHLPSTEAEHAALVSDRDETLEAYNEWIERTEGQTKDVADIHFETDRDAAVQALQEWDDNYSDELKSLIDFRDEVPGDGSFEAIRESDWVSYAQELAEDIGAIPKGVAWPYTCIDWEQAAKELQYDYTGADFDGVTYYCREM